MTAGYQDIYAKSVERWLPVCYTRANQGLASLWPRACVARLAAAKEEL